jgi:endonuclease III
MPSSVSIKIRSIRRLLFKRFGRLEARPEKDAVGELVKTILSQNTSDATSLRAFDNLKKVSGIGTALEGQAWIRSKKGSSQPGCPI